MLSIHGMFGDIEGCGGCIHLPRETKRLNPSYCGKHDGNWKFHIARDGCTTIGGERGEKREGGGGGMVRECGENSKQNHEEVKPKMMPKRQQHGIRVKASAKDGMVPTAFTTWRVSIDLNKYENPFKQRRSNHPTSK